MTITRCTTHKPGMTGENYCHLNTDCEYLNSLATVDYDFVLELFLFSIFLPAENVMEKRKSPTCWSVRQISGNEDQLWLARVPAWLRVDDD